ncbi:MAG: phosphoserine phosphatase SerB [Deinococcales bacterium]
MKLCVFDFDSTLMDGETIDTLAAAFGKEAEVAAITHRAMTGELEFFEALVERVNLLKGLPYPQVLEICHNLKLMPGAEETVQALKAKGYKVLVFSGGFREATAFYAEKLGLDGDFANFLYQKKGFLTGQVGGEMMYGDAKGQMLLRLQKLLNISPGDTVAVGDGANDLSMFAHSGKKIAFCAKPILEGKADHLVKEKDLRLILEYL